MVGISPFDSEDLLDNYEDIYDSLETGVRKGHEKIVSLLLEFISNVLDSSDYYATGRISKTLHEARENVTAAEASAESTEERAKSYWEIYSMLLKHSADEK